jgi:hypothetical protein
VAERFLGIPVWVVLAGLAGLVAALALYGRGLGAELPEYQLGERQIAERARAFTAGAGVDTTGSLAVVQTLELDNEDFGQLVARHGLDAVRAGRRDGSLPLPAWRVRLRHNVTTEEEEDDPHAVSVTLDERGRVLGARFFGLDSDSPAPARDEARRMAALRLAAFGVDLTGFGERSERRASAVEVERTDEGVQVRVNPDPSAPPSPEPEAPAEKTADSQSFVWERTDPRWPDTTLRVKAALTGAGLESFSHEVDVDDAPMPPGFVSMIVQGTVYGIALTILVIILLAVLLSRFITRDNVSLERALVVTMLFGGGCVVSAVISSGFGSSMAELAFGTGAIVVFAGILVWAAWMAGEADAYYAWGPQSTEAAVALLTGRFLARQVARSAVEGLLWGWLMLGALAIVAALVAALGGSSLVHGRTDSYAIDAHPSPLFWLGLAPYVIAVSVIGLLFAPAWVHRVTRRGWIAIPLGGAVAGMLANLFGIADVRFGALPQSLSWSVPFGVACAAIVARRGWLTAATAVFVFSTWFYGIAPIVAGGAYDAVMAGAGLALATAPALAALALGPRLADTVVLDAPPPRISRIMEQARREEELNIARRVQNALLPREDPVVDGLDIAGACTPANEVGGDYYDYFVFPDGRFGVAVGDVSGKGVPAAFCMTLTKGFMEVAAAEATSPESVLALANSYLRGNLARGTFVTMTYAVFDPESRVVTCARAGHNPPAILRDGAAPEFVNASGAALGAADDEQFVEIIESVRIELRRGDTLVFYTDGVTEAMNAAREQFGEERLLRTLARLRGEGTARAMLDGLLGEIDDHARDADQHDDITVVVIRAA